MNSPTEELRWAMAHDFTHHILQSRCGHIWGNTTTRFIFITTTKKWTVFCWAGPDMGVLAECGTQADAEQFAEAHHWLKEQACQ